MSVRIPRYTRLLIAAGLLVAALASALMIRPQPARAVDGVSLQEVGSFSSPVYVTGSPTGGLFVVEQSGDIRIIRNGQLRSRPFLNIKNIVNSDGGEQGLLSVAFPPNYGQTHRFYVYFTDHNCRGSNCNNEIDEFRRSSGNRNRAFASTRRKVIEFNHKDYNTPDDSNHNGGQLQFGPGGYLFAGTGDGGSGDDPPNNALNKHVLLGKLIRIIPRPRHGRPYGMPASNPYVGRDGRNEIFSIGLRNPWRWSFDFPSGKAPRVAIGDVGQGQTEEVDYERVGAANGGDFGWSKFEGDHLNPNGTDAARFAPPPVLTPIHTFDHGGSGFTGCAIIGGYVVRHSSLPSLAGRYLYSDSCNAQLRSFVPSLGGATGDSQIGSLALGSTSSFGVDNGHHYYVADLGGPVYRLVEN